MKRFVTELKKDVAEVVTQINVEKEGSKNPGIAKKISVQNRLTNALCNTSSPSISKMSVFKEQVEQPLEEDALTRQMATAKGFT